MVLIIKMGEEKEKRLARHLQETHPSTRGKITVLKKRKGKKLNTKRVINRIIKSVPDFKKQAEQFTKV